MSFAEKINQTILEFFENYIDLIITSRQSLQHQPQPHQNPQTQPQPQPQQPQIQQQQLKSQLSSDSIQIISDEDFATFLQEQDQNPNRPLLQVPEKQHNYLQKFIEKNPLWLLPDDKEIVIEIYFQTLKVEDYHFKFFHQNHSDSLDLDQKPSDFQYKIDPSFTNLSLLNQQQEQKKDQKIRDPDHFKQILQQLQSQITRILDTLPLKPYILQNKNKHSQLDQQQELVNFKLKFNSDTVNSSIFQEKNHLKYKVQGLKTIYQQQQLLQHEFLFYVQYPEKLEEKIQQYLQNQQKLRQKTISEQTLYTQDDEELDSDNSQEETKNQQQQTQEKQIQEIIYDEKNPRNEQFYKKQEEFQKNQSFYQQVKKKFRKISDNDLNTHDLPENKQKILTLSQLKKQKQKLQEKSQNIQQNQQSFSESLEKTIPCLQFHNLGNSEQIEEQNEEHDQEHRKKQKFIQFQEKINNMQFRLEGLEDPYPRKLGEMQKVLETQVQNFETAQQQKKTNQNSNSNQN